MAFNVNVVTLNDGGTAISATGDDTAPSGFQLCASAVLVITCTAVASAGIFVPKLQGSTDGGTTFADLVPATGSAAAAVDTKGVVQTYRYNNVPPVVRTHWTKTSGTSVTAVATLVGMGVHDTASATAV